MSGLVSIRDLVAQGFYQKALTFYAKLRSTGFLPNRFTYPCLLKACSHLPLRAPSLAQQLHAQVVKFGRSLDTHNATALISLYSKLGHFGDALKVFDEMPERPLALYNAVVSGFSRSGMLEGVLCGLRWIRKAGIVPNSVTLASALSGCEEVGLGALLHGCAVKVGCELDVYVGTSILTMYARCEEVESAFRVFEMMPEKKVVTWNSMMCGLLHNGFGALVFDVFVRMGRCLDENPSLVTWITLLASCSQLPALQYGRQIHCFLVKRDVKFEVQIVTALVDMYWKCGNPRCASQVFENLTCKNLLTWNSMISGMLLYGQINIALELFHRLGLEGLEPDMATWNAIISGFSRLGNGFGAYEYFNKMQVVGKIKPSSKIITSLLPACSALSDLKHGKVVHGYAIRMNFYVDKFLLTGLIDMYMKCGDHCLARRIFDMTDMKLRDAAMWNAMINGYGRNGEDELGLDFFHQMLNINVKPSSATFLSVLSACDHTGQVEKAQELFRRMGSDFGIVPTEKHFSCMIDILGRAGRLSEAQNLIEEIRVPSGSHYSSLLGSCRLYSDVELGEKMAAKLANLTPEDPTPFVVLSHIYAEYGEWEQVERIWEILKQKGLQKDPGCSRTLEIKQ